VLIYATVPGFYAEVERSRDPSLRGRPVIVGGDPRKRGLVQSASEDATAAGVAVGMPVLEALALCPHARVRKTDMRCYREATAQLRSCFRLATEKVEPAGLDAAYLDVAGGDDAPEAIASRLREAVAGELGLPLRLGIAPVRFLAKLAAEQSGDAGLLSVRPGEVRRFLDPLPVERLPGVGPRTRETLLALGAACVADLLKLGQGRLEEALGNHGRAIFALAPGAASAHDQSREHAGDPRDRSWCDRGAPRRAGRKRRGDARARAARREASGAEGALRRSRGDHPQPHREAPAGAGGRAAGAGRGPARPDPGGHATDPGPRPRRQHPGPRPPRRAPARPVRAPVASWAKPGAQ
jgi:nucleotidyltransferase/DNA polymerase involved in DNA repair